MTFLGLSTNCFRTGDAIEWSTVSVFVVGDSNRKRLPPIEACNDNRKAFVTVNARKPPIKRSHALKELRQRLPRVAEAPALVN